MTDTPKFKNMIIRDITLNGITINFHNEINIVSNEIFDIVKIILLRKSERLVPVKLFFSATVTIDEEMYIIQVSNGIFEVYKNGQLASEEYFSLLTLSPEQRLFLDFDCNKTPDLSRKFMYYKDMEYYYPNHELQKDTLGISETRSFRNYYNKFIENLSCQNIKLNSKRKLIKLDDKGEIIKFSSRIDRQMFNFECFLILSEFWDGFNRIRDIHSVMQPITAAIPKAVISNICDRQIFVKEQNNENMA